MAPPILVPLPPTRRLFVYVLVFAAFLNAAYDFVSQFMVVLPLVEIKEKGGGSGSSGGGGGGGGYASLFRGSGPINDNNNNDGRLLSYPTTNAFYKRQQRPSSSNRDNKNANDDGGTKQKTKAAAAAMCAIQKWATSEVDEWVNYHWSIGFSHFVIYDNSDSFELEGWARKRKQQLARAAATTATASADDGGGTGTTMKPPQITVKHWPGLAQQLAVYKDCAEHLQKLQKEQRQQQRDANDNNDNNDNNPNDNDNNSIANNDDDDDEPILEWVAYFDLDEFLMLKKHDRVQDFLAEYCPDPECGALTINYILFGPNGETGYAPLPLTKRFQYRTAQVAPQFKTVARLSSLGGQGGRAGKYGAHCFPLLEGEGVYYDTMGTTDRCPRNIKKDGYMDVAVLHHYFTKSREEWNMRCSRGSVAHTTPKRCNQPVPSEGFDTFDDSAWTLLKRHFPQYEWYDDNEWLFGHEHQRQQRQQHFEQQTATAATGGGSSRSTTTTSTSEKEKDAEQEAQAAQATPMSVL